MDLLRVENLTFEYPGKRALDRVSFSIPAGSITALVGPNGAGKTTLMNCLVGVARPVFGSVHIKNISVLDEPRLCHRNMGYLPDFLGLYKELTVRQSLRYIALAQNLPQETIPQTVESVARRVHLFDRLDNKSETLSRGLKQNLAIGQTIIHEPELLLLDEPASGLDPEARRKLSELLLELGREGKTILVSSHILAELEDYSTHMLVIRDGRVLEHTALTVDASTEGVALTLQLAAAVADLPARLEKLEGVDQVRADGREAEFRFRGDEGAQHRLLKQLIDSGLPVCALVARKDDLQERYIKKMSG